MDKRWALPPACRTQQVLYPVMLDEIVPPNAPIRLLWALLSELDWTPWERRYHGHRGQPPIHPMLLAGCILYGLLRGIRSSRDLEEATRIRLDYLWFLEGRTVDHSTFSQFRTRFATELKDLNRQIARKLHELTREAFATLFLDVASGGEEDPIALPALEEARAIFGALPRHVVADGKVLRGATVETLESLDVAVLSPLGTDFSASNPAHRADPSQPVPEARRDQLPKRSGKFSQAAFVYDAQRDCYQCPAGRTLAPLGNGRTNEAGIFVQKYGCPGREGCPYARDCLDEKTRARTVARDQYQGAREDVGRRMATPMGQELYGQRAPTVEVVFARIKGQMGIRGFLLRGLAKVRVEWSWICASYNLKLLLGVLGKAVGCPGKGLQDAGGGGVFAAMRLLVFPGRAVGAGGAALPLAA